MDCYLIVCPMMHVLTSYSLGTLYLCVGVCKVHKMKFNFRTPKKMAENTCTLREKNGLLSRNIKLKIPK